MNLTPNNSIQFTVFIDSPNKMDSLIEKQCGQDVIDSLSVLEAAVPTFHQDLWSTCSQLFPKITLALRSKFAIIRQCAARCFATICDVMTTEAMHFVIETVVPYLGDTSNLSNRQGATELIYRELYYVLLSLPMLSLFFQTLYRNWTSRHFLT